MAKPGPNDLCSCGSGRKFKKCCRSSGGLFSKALAHHQRQEIEQAAALYTRILETDPGHPDALHGLGVIACDLRDYTAAAGFLRQAAERKPESASIHHSLAVALQSAGLWEDSANSFARAIALDPSSAASLLRLGVSLHALGELADAATCFVRTIQLEPANIDAHNNLGVVRQNQGLWEEAAACFQNAITLKPDYGEGYNNLGAALRTLGRAGESVPQLLRAIELQPASVNAHYNLGLAWKSLGRQEEAAAAFSETVRLQPDHEQAHYFLHALRGDVAPATTPAALVADLFDGYAERFDQHLQGSLAYRTPALLREAFAGTGAAGPFDILDLGCGTGLAGEAFRDVAGRLAGADLSPRMVEKARARGIYQELWVEDILTALGRAHTGYGIILAADVFVYVGDLGAIFAACRQSLQPGGWFLFSTETTAGETYRLSADGRFQHPPAYIRALTLEHGFLEVSSRSVALRKERGQPVPGDLYVLCRRDAAESHSIAPA